VYFIVICDSVLVFIKSKDAYLSGVLFLITTVGIEYLVCV